MKDSSPRGRKIEQKRFSFDMNPAEHRTNLISADTSEEGVKGEPAIEKEVHNSMENDERRGCLPGGVLAAERKRRGYSVAEIAGQLFLTERQISALEADDYDHFPAPIFVTGYIRNYARQLGLPPDPLVELFNAQNTSSEPKLDRVTRTSGHVPTSGEKPFDPRIVIGTVVIVTIIALLLWGMPSGEEEAVALNEAVMTDDVSLTSPIATNDNPSPLLATTPEIEKQPPILKEEVTAPAVAVDVTPVEVAPVVSAVSALAPQAEFIADRAAEGVYPDTIELTFTAESWVEITDANGRRVMFDLGKPGQTRALSGTAPFKVLLGLSPAVTMTYNGELFDQSIYTRGKVARFTLGERTE